MREMYYQGEIGPLAIDNKVRIIIQEIRQLLALLASFAQVTDIPKVTFKYVAPFMSSLLDSLFDIGPQAELREKMRELIPDKEVQAVLDGKLNQDRLSTRQRVLLHRIQRNRKINPEADG